jgi:hypothetical protein
MGRLDNLKKTGLPAATDSVPNLATFRFGTTLAESSLGTVPKLISLVHRPGASF